MSVVEPVASVPGNRIHLAGDLLSIMLNVRQWNDDIETPAGAERWGARTVTYFVLDPRTGHFAPSKFCAYVAIPSEPSRSGSLSTRLALMTIDVYTQAESIGRRLDGHEARDHLTRNLAMDTTLPGDAAGPLLALFSRWLELHQAQIRVHPSGPRFLVPPAWFH